MIAILSFVAALSGQEAPVAPPASDEIVVTGKREGTLDLERLIAAREVFVRHRPTFAPASRLWFVLSQGDLPIRLTLRDGERSVQVPVDAEGRFALDASDTGKWELVHDRGSRPVRLRALVLSPEASEADRPLGDLRLQCRVAWKLMKGEVGFAGRALFDMVDGCGSRRVGIYYQTRRPLAGGTIATPSGTKPLSLGPSQQSFRAPLADRTLPNAARVRLTYR